MIIRCRLIGQSVGWFLTLLFYGIYGLFFFASLPLSNCLISLLTSPFHPKELDNGFMKEGKINPVPLARDNDAKNVMAKVGLDGEW